MVNELGNISEIIVACATILIAIMTIIFNIRISEIQKYQAKQYDRKVIQDIFEIQAEAKKILYRPKEFVSDEARTKLVNAKNLASLYGLRDIELHIEKILKSYSKAIELFYENHNEDGTKIDNFSRGKMVEYVRQAQIVREYISDVSCYKNLLKIGSINDL